MRVAERTHAVRVPNERHRGFLFGKPCGHFAVRAGVSRGSPGASSASGLWLRFRSSTHLVLSVRQQSSRCRVATIPVMGHAGTVLCARRCAGCFLRTVSSDPFRLLCGGRGADLSPVGKLRHEAVTSRAQGRTAEMRSRTGWLQSQALHLLLPLCVALFTSRTVPLRGQTESLWDIAHTG